MKDTPQAWELLTQLAQQASAMQDALLLLLLEHGDAIAQKDPMAVRQALIALQGEHLLLKDNKVLNWSGPSVSHLVKIRMVEIGKLSSDCVQVPQGPSEIDEKKAEAAATRRDCEHEAKLSGCDFYAASCGQFLQVTVTAKLGKVFRQGLDHQLTYNIPEGDTSSWGSLLGILEGGLVACQDLGCPVCIEALGDAVKKRLCQEWEGEIEINPAPHGQLIVVRAPDGSAFLHNNQTMMKYTVGQDPVAVWAAVWEDISEGLIPART